jgi:hypothetical protein
MVGFEQPIGSLPAGQTPGGQVHIKINVLSGKPSHPRSYLCKDVAGMLLNRDDWYETSRDLDWTLSYVDEDAAFPTE